MRRYLSPLRKGGLAPDFVFVPDFWFSPDFTSLFVFFFFMDCNDVPLYNIRIKAVKVLKPLFDEEAKFLFSTGFYKRAMFDNFFR